MYTCARAREREGAEKREGERERERVATKLTFRSHERTLTASRRRRSAFRASVQRPRGGASLAIRERFSSLSPSSCTLSLSERGEGERDGWSRVYTREGERAARASWLAAAAGSLSSAEADATVHE